MEHVDKIVNKLEFGATEPFEGIINGERVFIKTFNNRWSNKILVNEYLCLKLAQVLDMPIPNGGICLIDEYTEIGEDVDLDYDETIEGVGFYSKRLEKATKFMADVNLARIISNKEDINKIILFDHLIYNDDRHDGNLLLTMNNRGMYIIDHSHVFNLKHNWTEEGLAALMLREDYMDLKILQSNLAGVYTQFIEIGIVTKEKLINQSEQFKEKINEQVITNIIDEMPEVWVVNKKELLKLVEYLLYRLNHLNIIIENIISYLNMSGGV